LNAALISRVKSILPIILLLHNCVYLIL
jgi:hypothetical protein